MGEETLIICLEQENGEEREFEVVGTFGVEDQDYMALLPRGEENGVYLIGFHAGENDEILFDPITDDETYQRIGEIFESLFNGGEDEIEEYDMQDTYEAELEEVDRLMEAYDDQEEYCYQDEQGRYYIYNADDEIVYLDENGDPIIEEPQEDVREGEKAEDQDHE